MKQKIKIPIYCIAASLVIIFGYAVFESFTTKAETNSNFNVLQDVTSGISLACDESIVLNPAFPSKLTGLTPESGPASDDFDCTVVTNNSSGFGLSIKNADLGSSGVALLHSTNSNYKFSNYTATPTYNWVNPSAGQALFGFAIGASASSEAANDISSALKNNSTVCGSGSNTNDINSMSSAKCWRGLNDTTNIMVVSSDDETTIDGETFRFRFQARANAIALKAGYYTTNMTVTATY